MSLAIRDQTVLPATQHKWTHPALTPARQAGTRFTYPAGLGMKAELTYLVALYTTDRHMLYTTAESVKQSGVVFNTQLLIYTSPDSELAYPTPHDFLLTFHSTCRPVSVFCFWLRM